MKRTELNLAERRTIENLLHHTWLDPLNAKIWLHDISSILATIDLENAERNKKNAAQGQDALDETIATITATVIG